MMENKALDILLVDIETGGLVSPTSILTIDFLLARFTTKEVAVKDTLSLKLIPDDGNIIVNSDALKINKIDISEHSNNAVTYTEGGKRIEEFLKKYSKSPFRIPLSGQYILSFDLPKIFESGIISRDLFHKYVDHRVLDIIPIAQYLKIRGDLPYALPLNLKSLAKYFKIPLDEDKSHAGDYDNKIAAVVLFHLLRI